MYYKKWMLRFCSLYSGNHSHSISAVTDKDECVDPNIITNCGSNANCVNNVTGTYHCECNEGYVGNGMDCYANGTYQFCLLIIGSAHTINILLSTLSPLEPGDNLTIEIAGHQFITSH